MNSYKSRVPIIVLCMLTLLCLGLVYGYSIFVAPLEKEFGWVRSETSLTFTISMIAMCLGIMCSGRINNSKNKPLMTLVVGAVLIALGFIIASTTHALITFYIAYGVGVGFGVGFAYSQLISVGTKLIPGRQGMLSGILMMCFGLGALILGAVCSSLMAAVGWRTTFWLIGIVFGILLVITGLCMQIVVKKIQAETQANQKASADNRSDNDFTSAQMFATADYKLFYVWLILLSAAGLALMGHIAPCAIQIGAAPTTAALFAGLTSVSNGLGRLIYGTVYDKLGVKKTATYISVIFIIAAVVAAVAVTMGSIVLLAVGCVLIGISFGASPTSSSAVTVRFYGPKYFSSNFGITSTNLILAAFLGPYLAGWLYTTSGTYVTTFYCVIVFAVLALVVSTLMVKIAAKHGRHLD